MPAVRTAKKRIHKSPIGPVPGRPQRPAVATKAALLKGMKSLPPPVLSQSPSAIPWTLYSPDSISRLTPAPIMQQESRLPVKVTPSPGETGDGDIAERGLGTGETSSMRLTRELQAALEEGENARRQDELDEDQSTASSISWRAKRNNRRAIMAEKAEKAARGLAPGRKVLRGKRAGVTKHKKGARRQKESNFPNKGAELELDDASMLDRTISPEGSPTDTSMKDPSPGSGNVSIGDASGDSPEDRIGGNRVETERGMSAMGTVRRIGRHLGIFIAAVQDCTNDLRESGEYKAWRDFLGEL